MRIAAIALCALTSLISFQTALGAQRRAVLDLTAPKPPSPRDQLPATGIADATGRGSHETPAGSPPLRLHVEWIDRPVYLYGDPFIIHIVIENAGSEPISVPWARDDGRVFDPAGAEWTTAVTLSLQLDVPNRSPLRAALGVIYASDADPVSVLVLKPGEKAEIWASGRLTNYRSQGDVEFTGGRTVNARARLRWLVPEADRRYSEITSDAVRIDVFARSPGLR